MSDAPMKILFVGETWKGSSARSLREALAVLPGITLDEIGEDHYFPRGRSMAVRVANRVLRPWHQRELAREIATKLDAFKPDVLMVYKGSGVAAEVVQGARQSGVYTVNVFPDCSPHAHGAQLRASVGAYDLVVSTKPFHPADWRSTYGYRNPCVFVPHGYDPAVHYWPDAPDSSQQIFDLVMVSGWRPQYHELLRQLARHEVMQALRVGLAGPGWLERAHEFPRTWTISPGLHGKAYGEFLRQGKIVIAPVHRELMLNGVRQPGDEDTTRTYELAAAGCFFLHCRTPYAKTVFDEASEVPMWNDADELADLIARYLPLENERRTMAARAHARAVTAYSIPSRAAQVLRVVSESMKGAGMAKDAPA